MRTSAFASATVFASDLTERLVTTFRLSRAGCSYRFSPARIAFRLAVVFLLILAFGTLGKVRAQEGKPLVFGMELTFAPFEMTDKEGKPTGISVEMAYALGAYLKRPVVIQNMTFDGLIPALKTRKIDIILSSMTATDERRKSIDFSDTYINTGLCALVGKNSPVKTAEDINKESVTVAVRAATTSQMYARDHLKKARILVLEEEAPCVASVVQGKADLYIYDQIAILQHWQRHKETTRAILKPIKEESWAMGLRQGNTELRDQINAFLKQYRTEGGFEKLGDKYLNDAKKAFAEQGVQFVF